MDLLEINPVWLIFWFVEEVANYLDSGYPVDVIYLDFQKTFDKVYHIKD